MKKKIVLYGTFTPQMLALLKDNCPTDFDVYHVNKNEDLSLLVPADYMICRAVSINHTILNTAANLKAIQKWGVGYDKIDIADAGARGIPVMISLGGNSIPVAELTVALMLDVLRHISTLNTRLKSGIWAREEFASQTYMLHGKTVGLVGIGHIAKEVAKIVHDGFNCKVLYYDIAPLDKDEEKRLKVHSVSLKELMSLSDIVSVHIPLLESTRKLINYKLLNLMKPTACLINTSRGGVINEDDLIAILKGKRILGAGLDTFCEEPVPPDAPILAFDNVVVTPHCGGNTNDNDQNMANICMANILQYDQHHNKRMESIVNYDYLQ